MLNLQNQIYDILTPLFLAVKMKLPNRKKDADAVQEQE